jgi:hypothetical protein
MALSREDRIRLAYKSIVQKIKKEGLDREHARAVLYIAEAFSITPLKVQKIVARNKKITNGW